MFKAFIAVFALFAVAFANPIERQERQAVYTTYGGGLVGSPLAYGATPYVASPYSSGYYSGVPAISTYSSYPSYSGVYPGYPGVRYY